MREKIIWIGGYPFVEGVNAPKTKGVGTQSEVKPKPADKTQPTAPTGGHDLRAGHATIVIKPLSQIAS